MRGAIFPWRGGNRFALLLDGPQFFPRMLAAIEETILEFLVTGDCDLSTDDYLRDGMFVYLPAVKRVRRVTGTFADGALMGTNFSYFDFKQLQNTFGDARN